MKVLVVHNRYRSAEPSGENAVVDDEVRLLREHGCTVELLEVESDAIAGWPALRKATLPGRVVWSRAGARLVANAVAVHSPDVVHVHNTFPLLSPAALSAAHRTGAGVVQTLHNFRPLCPAATFLRDGKVCEDCLGRVPLPALLHRCYRGSAAATAPLVAMSAFHAARGTWRDAVDLSIAPSEFTRGRYVAAGWPPERIVVKPNTAHVEAPPRVGPGGPFVCLSRLVPEKGIAVLLEAWRLAFPAGEQRLEVIGAGEQAGLVRAAAAAPSSGIELVGPLPRAEALARLSRARALVVPSLWYEVFPRTIVEAFALGVPVVASRIGSLAELVEHEGTGLQFECGSAAALADTLRMLAADDALSERLGAEARRTYERQLSPAATTARLIAVYERATATRRQAAA